MVHVTLKRGRGTVLFVRTDPIVTHLHGPPGWEKFAASVSLEPQHGFQQQGVPNRCHAFKGCRPTDIPPSLLQPQTEHFQPARLHLHPVLPGIIVVGNRCKQVLRDGVQFVLVQEARQVG